MTSPASPVLEERATLNVTIECGPKTRGGAGDAHQTHGKAPHLHHQKQEGCSNGTGLERGEEEPRSSGRGRKRQRKTSEQVTILEAHFVANPLPDKALRDRLGLQLGLTTRQIQIWFQNKRAKAKQEHLLKPPTSHTTEAPPHLLPANTGQIVNASSAAGTSSTTKRKRPEPSETATPSVATTTSKHSPAAAPTRTAMGIAANTEPVPMSSNSPASPLQAQPHFSANRAAGRVVCHRHYSHQHQSHQLRPFLNQHQHKRHHSQAQPLCRPSGVHCHHHPQQKKQPPPLHHLLLNTPQPMWAEGNVGSTTSSFSSPIEHVLTDHDLLLLGTDEPQRLDDGKSPGQACLELELQSLLLEYLEKDMVN